MSPRKALPLTLVDDVILCIVMNLTKAEGWDGIGVLLALKCGIHMIVVSEERCPILPWSLLFCLNAFN